MEQRIKMMLPQLNERQRRLFLALAYGRGGIAEVTRYSGASRNTVKKGMVELKNGAVYDGK
ncbi:MAG: ISAzo13 family transposase, partial [Candidatus Accumulibacter sp.]|nr:ISAzo13 family transposase [Accumulibacter sp.]